MDRYDLSRFTKAHRNKYQQALSEIRTGRKETHWMWFIFPQIKGLGSSVTAEIYAIESIDEAKQFLADPYLGGNLREISDALLTLRTNNPREIFPHPDHMKLRSSMTLFSIACEEKDNVFEKVLSKFFGGIPDSLTLELLEIR